MQAINYNDLFGPGDDMKKQDGCTLLKNLALVVISFVIATYTAIKQESLRMDVFGNAMIKAGTTVLFGIGIGITAKHIQLRDICSSIYAVALASILAGAVIVAVVGKRDQCRTGNTAPETII